MKLIVGLGNPGPKYENTRHNIGFKVLDYFQKNLGFEKFSLNKKINSLVSSGNISNEKIILAKPQKFMNESGKAVLKLLNYYSLTAIPYSLFIIHDDSDLEIGKIKISISRGSAGHKGIESIIKALKTNNFTRFRIGIRPKKETAKAEKFVLKKFGLTEKLILKKTIQNATDAILLAIKENLEKAMSQFNQ